MPVKVFGSPTSPDVARVMTCLFEKEIEFQLICVDSFRSTKRLPQPPHGEAVAFEDGDVTLVGKYASHRCKTARENYQHPGVHTSITC